MDLDEIYSWEKFDIKIDSLSLRLAIKLKQGESSVKVRGEAIMSYLDSDGYFITHRQYTDKTLTDSTWWTINPSLGFQNIGDKDKWTFWIEGSPHILYMITMFVNDSYVDNPFILEKKGE